MIVLVWDWVETLVRIETPWGVPLSSSWITVGTSPDLKTTTSTGRESSKHSRGILQSVELTDTWEKSQKKQNPALFTNGKCEWLWRPQRLRTSSVLRCSGRGVGGKQRPPHPNRTYSHTQQSSGLRNSYTEAPDRANAASTLNWPRISKQVKGFGLKISQWRDGGRVATRDVQ